MDHFNKAAETTMPRVQFVHQRAHCSLETIILIRTNTYKRKNKTAAFLNIKYILLMFALGDLTDLIKLMCGREKEIASKIYVNGDLMEMVKQFNYLGWVTVSIRH